jgi:hypothetical protein
MPGGDESAAGRRAREEGADPLHAQLKELREAITQRLPRAHQHFSHTHLVAAGGARRIVGRCCEAAQAAAALLRQQDGAPVGPPAAQAPPRMRMHHSYAGTPHTQVRASRKQLEAESVA